MPSSLTSPLPKTLLILITMMWANIAHGSENVVRIALGEAHKAPKSPDKTLSVEMLLSHIYKEANTDCEFIYATQRARYSICGFRSI